METVKRFSNQDSRNLFAAVVAMDPAALPMVRRFLEMGARNVRHDWMLVRSAATGRYDRIPDPCAFHGDIGSGLGVSLIRGRNGEWFINGN